MITVVFAIAPIFLLIVLGNVLRRNGIPSIEFWNLNDKLVYWVLFPALLFVTTSTLDLSGAQLGSYTIVILAGFAGAVLYSLGVVRAFKLSGPVGTSVLQGCARHNTFIAMAVAETLFGAEGLALAALVTAVLIPITNIAVVSLMVGMLPHDPNRSIVGAVARDLARNPLLISVVLGLVANLAGLGVVPVLHDTLGILAAAALPIVLLCVGANLRIMEMRASVRPVLLSMLGKFVVFPVGMFIAIAATGLTGVPALIAMIFACVPTAASGFTLARQMGGDAPLAAAIVTLQTAVSFVFLPLVIVLLGGYFGVTP
jgi:malonate transporter